MKIGAVKQAAPPGIKLEYLFQNKLIYNVQDLKKTTTLTILNLS